MAKKDKNEDEYKENLDNASSNDDEDFGLPDLDDEDTSAEENSEDEETTEFELPSKEEVSSEAVTFETDTDSSDDDDEYITEDAADDSIIEEDVIEEEEHDEEFVAATPSYTPPKQSPLPVIITLSIIIILACVAVYFIFIKEPKKEVVKETPVEDTTTYVVEKPVEVEEPVIEEVESEPEATINTLNTRTGRSYVVVGSFFDDDLAMDYAKDLKKKGTTSYIIPPFGKSKFTRVAVEETGSFAEASTIANELAGQYKEQPWPLKY